MAPPSLRLADFLDEEVLAIVLDLGGHDGWITSEEFALAVDMPTNAVGSRFSWLRRYGVLERDLRPGPTFRHWRLTEMGEAVVKARFGKSQQTTIDNLDELQLPLAMQSIAARYEGSGNRVVMNLVRRRFQASIVRRR